MIIKRRYTAGFTTILNTLFEDERLAADEVGILAYLRSRPHDWEVRRPALARRWKMGRDAIKRVMANLVRTGWCIARKDRLPNGTFFMIYEIRDEPGPTLSDDDVRRAFSLVSGEAASDENDVIVLPETAPHGAEPPTGYPSLADPPLADTEVAYIDIQNKDLPKTDSTQKFEREGARAREKHALNLVEFKRRWPTNVSDDQARVDGAWFDLSSEEGEAALAGIAPFLERLKRNHRKHPPAGFTYLGQKRWTLMEQPSCASSPTSHARDSVEAKALIVLHDIAGKGAFFHQVYVRDVGITYGKPVTPQLAALAQAGPKDSWPVLNRQQAGAWEALLRDNVLVQARQRLVEGSRAPWPWPPRKDGALSTAPPEAVLMTEDDINNFKV